MSVFSGITKIIEGAALIVGGAVIGGLTFGAAAPVSELLISAGAGMALSGLGTLIAGPGTGRQSAVASSRNPIKPWDVIVGRARVGGTLVYMNQWPPPGGYGGPTGLFSIFGVGPQSQRDANNFLDLVFVVASHRIASVDAVLFDGVPIAIDPTAAYYGKAGGPGKPTPTIGGTSYTPTQTNKEVNPGSFVRLNGVVTVTCPFDIPSLEAGDPIIHQDENGATNLTDQGLVGTFIVQQIISRVPNTSLVYTVLQGGLNVTVTNNGWVTTKWPNYGRDVYVEYMLGDQILGQTFNGLMGGTPFQGTGTGVNPNINSHNTGTGGTNPWTNSCSLQGKACVSIRLYYESQFFSAGLPQISFLVHGKPDIYDPRLGNCTGVKAVTLQTPGAGGYLAGDITTLVMSGGAGATVTITNVDSSGNPTSWVVTATGHGYAIGLATTTGGKGSGAEFNVTVLGGISSGLATVGIETGGQNYNLGDILQVGGTAGGGVYGSLGFLEVTSVGSGGSVTGVSILQPGYGYNIANALNPVPTTISGSAAFEQPFTSPSYAVGSGTGCTITISALTAGSPGSSAVYSENAALVIADYLADTTWGYSATYVIEASTAAPYNNIGITALTAYANVCDQAVSLADSSSAPIAIQGGTVTLPTGTEPMYACNGRFELSTSRGDVLRNLLTSCAGRLVYVEGLYSIQPGYWVGTGSPPFVVNLESIASGKPVWRPNVKIRDLFNAVKGTYINPSNNWEPSDFPYYAQDALHDYAGPSQYGGDINLAVDLGQRRFKDIHLPFTISAPTAQRLAKIELLRGRNQGGYGIGTGIFPLNMAGYQFVPLDVFEADFSFLGWTNKILEVTAVRFKSEARDSAPVIGTEIDVQETSSDIYAWSTAEELSPAGYTQGLAPSPSVSEVVPFPWSPGAVAPLNGDALYPAGVDGPGTFGFLPIYDAEASGVGTASLQISGVPPINALDSQLNGPFVSAYGSPTGGSLAPGTYVVGVSAFDADGVNVGYLDLATVVIGGGQGAGSVSVTAGGSGYNAGQGAYLVGGGNNCVVLITSVGGNGTVTGISLAAAGTGYATGVYSTVGGRGTGLTITINSLAGATATGSIIIFPDWGPGNNGGDVYMALQTVSQPQIQTLTAQGQMLAADVMHYQQTMTAGQVSATITSFNEAPAGGPDKLFDHFAVVWQQVVHSGPWAEQVQAVTSDTVTIYGPGMTLNQWAGYTLTLLAHYDPTVPVQVLNMPIASSTASGNVGGLADVVVFTSGAGGYMAGDVLTLAGGTGGHVTVNAVNGLGDITAWAITAPGSGYSNGAQSASGGHGSGAQFVIENTTSGTFVLTIGPNSASVQLPNLTTLLSVGDLVGVLYNATFTASSFTDPNIANGFYPTGDLATEAGHVAVVLTGVDAGDVQTIANVSGTNNITLNIQGSWQVTPNTGDVVIVCLPETVPEWRSIALQNPNDSSGVVVVGTPSIQNLLGQLWLFTVRTESAPPNNTTAPDFCHPKRMIYFFGATGTRAISAASPGPTWTMVNWDGLVEADCSGGDVTYNCLPFAEVPNQQFTIVKIDAGANSLTVNCFSGDTFADGSTSFSTSVKGGQITFVANA